MKKPEITLSDEWVWNISVIKNNDSMMPDEVKEAYEEMIDALIDMVKVAESDEWDKSTTGRQIIFKEAVKALKKAGVEFE